MLISASLTVFAPQAFPWGMEGNIEKIGNQSGADRDVVDIVGGELCIPEDVGSVGELHGLVLDGGVVPTEHPAGAKGAMHSSQVPNYIPPLTPGCE